jgi:Phage integrase family
MVVASRRRCTRREPSCAEHPVCDRWELRKFRKMFATHHHESGVSDRTLQAWLGHSSLDATLAYLKVADVRSERTRAQVNHIFAQFGQLDAPALLPQSAESRPAGA